MLVKTVSKLNQLHVRTISARCLAPRTCDDFADVLQHVCYPADFVEPALRCVPFVCQKNRKQAIVQVGAECPHVRHHASSEIIQQRNVAGAAAESFQLVGKTLQVVESELCKGTDRGSSLAA